MLVVQITDCHIAPPGVLLGGRVDTSATLRLVIERINALRPRPDAVLATGDLTNDAFPEEYVRLGELLAELEAPVFAIPGNHDDREQLRKLFPTVLPAGGPEEPIRYVVDDFALRLIGLDTTIPRRPNGMLDHVQLDWLDEQLRAAPDRPTLIFQHHPPFVTGIDWMDADAFIGADKFAAVLARHTNVEAVVCGHLHRPIHRRFGSTVASCWPSTGVQLALALDGERYLLAPDAPAFSVHRWDAEHGLVSHISYVHTELPWLPDAWTSRPVQ